jgi:hypothetical protein
MNKLTKYTILYLFLITLFVGCGDDDNKYKPPSKFEQGDLVKLKIGDIQGQILNKSYYGKGKWKYCVRLCKFSSTSPFLGGENDTSPIGTEWLNEYELEAKKEGR